MPSHHANEPQLDFVAFLNPAFESRAHAQELLGGGPHATAAAATATAAVTKGDASDADAVSFTIDRRTLDALNQLGLASSSAARLTPVDDATEPLPPTLADKGKQPAVTYSSAARSASGGTGTGTGTGTGDVSAALSKLSYGVDDLNRQLRAEINTHHSALLIQAGSVSTLEDNLRQIRGGLEEVESSVDRLRRKIALPCNELSASLARLQKLQRASDLARRASRFSTLARRLDAQMAEINGAPAKGSAAVGASGSGSVSPGRNGARSPTAASFGDRGLPISASDSAERILSEAALTLAELDVLLEDQPPIGAAPDGTEIRPPSIRAITAVEHHIAAVESNRDRVTEEMENMVRRGLQELNQSLLASSLQTAYNLSVLPTLVASLVSDLTEAIESRIRGTFDVASLAREALARAGEPAQTSSLASASSSVFYKSRAAARTEPTSANIQHFQSTLWTRLDSLVGDMAGCCTKVYVLERVLKLKRDSVTQASFLDDALTVLDDKPTFTFWTTLSTSFETASKEAARSSAFVQQTLSTQYPRLLRLFHEFFAKIALQSDTVYTQHSQSPETVLILRSISTFEALYLSRCGARLNEAVAAAFSGGARQPPAAQEGMTAARVLINELDAARFDPLLVTNVAKAVGKAVDAFVDRVEAMVASDYTATSMVGPLATVSQQTNADLITALYHFWSPLSRVMASYPANIQELLRSSIASVRQALLAIVNPLLVSVRRELSAIIARIHKTGFNKPMDPTSTSVYMQDISDKLNFIRRQILAPLRVGEMMKEWIMELCKYVLHRFVLHASIVSPLGEGGKLKLTTDLTTLEFAVSQLLSDYKLNLAALGEDFRALRAFRPLLFTETSALGDASQTRDVPAMVLFHHIIVRGSSVGGSSSAGGHSKSGSDASAASTATLLLLPHQAHRWQESEYVKYISEHSEVENRRLVEAVVKDWDARHSKEGDGASARTTEVEAEAEAVKLLKEVLARDKQG